VLGTLRGLALIDSFPGVDAIVVDAAGALHYSSGLVAPAAASAKADKTNPPGRER